ncbi:hypothetical protein [Sulfobacillus harzensis]|uniref:Uncharacterized protein n=1 Tax=Sulfobacillus harzensis TaxID=2729629 RepID=A0A7Y0L565_9FIRM|nr:hypothetical protein [Sulfobacillus harzensis]NMP23425.1 hypothetical protein [Sulfobacillus harzensis]
MTNAEWIIIIAGGALAIGGLTRSRRQDQGIAQWKADQEAKAEAFEAAPVVNSHRVKCPDCGEWATLMVNQAGRQRRVCDECGTEDL